MCSRWKPPTGWRAGPQAPERARGLPDEDNHLCVGELDLLLYAGEWVGMVASLADFSAGLEGGDKVAEAVRNYALTQVEYLRTVNDYNMNVAELARLTGELK